MRELAFAIAVLFVLLLLTMIIASRYDHELDSRLRVVEYKCGVLQR